MVVERMGRMMVDTLTLEPPKGSYASRVAVIDSGDSFYGVQKQVERLRSIRLTQLLQLGVLLESGRCATARGSIEAYGVQEAAGKLGVEVTRHPYDNTFWFVHGGGIRFNEGDSGARNCVEVIVRLNPERKVDKSDRGTLKPRDIMTLMYSGNGIYAYGSSQLVFEAATRRKTKESVNALCETGDAHDGKGLELRIKIPESRTG